MLFSIRKVLKDPAGQGLVEYSFIVFAVALVLIAAFRLIGTSSHDKLKPAAESLV